LIRRGVVIVAVMGETPAAGQGEEIPASIKLGHHKHVNLVCGRKLQKEM